MRASDPSIGPEPDRMSLLDRARALTRRRALDDALAAGADPARDPALALRARQLVRGETRRAFAAGLERLLAEAEHPPFRPLVVAPFPRAAILAARREIVGVLAVLRADRPVYAGGMALVSQLLHEGSGPAHNPNADRSLPEALRLAAGALDGGWPRSA